MDFRAVEILYRVWGIGLRVSGLVRLQGAQQHCTRFHSIGTGAISVKRFRVCGGGIRFSFKACEIIGEPHITPKPVTHALNLGHFQVGS